MKIPENVIRQKLAEIKQGGAHSPAKAFTSAMKTYATTTLQKREMSALTSFGQLTASMREIGVLETKLHF